jgi:hypothetical protein
MTEHVAAEGPRSFTRWFEKLGDAQANHDMSVALHELGGVLRAQSLERGEAKGEITLTLKFKVDAYQQVITSYAIKVKEPEPARPSSMFWLTKGGNLGTENPRQTTLPLREVVNEDGEIVDAFGDERPARGV